MRSSAGQASWLRMSTVCSLRCAKQTAAALILSGLAVGVSGCAENPNYPSVAKIVDLDNILSPEERQKAIQELNKQQQSSSDAAKGSPK